MGVSVQLCSYSYVCSSARLRQCGETSAGRRRIGSYSSYLIHRFRSRESSSQCVGSCACRSFFAVIFNLFYLLYLSSPIDCRGDNKEYDITY